MEFFDDCLINQKKKKIVLHESQMDSFEKLIQPGATIDKRVTRVIARQENLLKEKFKVNVDTEEEEPDDVSSKLGEPALGSRSQSMPIPQPDPRKVGTSMRKGTAMGMGKPSLQQAKTVYSRGST